MKFLTLILVLISIQQVCGTVPEGVKGIAEAKEDRTLTDRLNAKAFRRKLADLKVQQEINFLNLQFLATGNLKCPIVKDLEDLRQKLLSGEIDRSQLNRKLLEALGN